MADDQAKKMGDEAAFPAVGDYAMHHMGNRDRGTLVRLAERGSAGGFFIEYVPNGGSSGWWPSSEFHPITDPNLLLEARLHAARRRASDLAGETKATARLIEVLESARAVVADAMRAALSKESDQ